MKAISKLLVVGLVVTVVLAGCAPAAPEATPAPQQPAQEQPAAESAAAEPAQGQVVTVNLADFPECAALGEPQPLAEGAQASTDTIAYKDGKITLAYLPMGTEFNFHVALNEGIEDLTKKSDSDQLDSFMLSPYSGSDQAGQMGMLQDVTARPDVSAIVLISFDEKSLAPLVEEAVNAGKAVVIINSDIKDYPTPVHGVIGVSQRDANHKLYDWAAAKLGGETHKVAILEGQPGYLNDERSGGFKDGVATGKWETVASVNGGWAVETGNTAAMDVLQAHPDTEVIFAANDYMAQGAALAAEQLGRNDLMILGYDGDPNALEDIARGKITATTNASPVVMGRLAACYAIKLLNRQSTGGYVNTPTDIVTKDNVAQVLCNTEDMYPKPSDEILQTLNCQ
jgi:ribose transport system substrate-binding protein